MLIYAIIAAVSYLLGSIPFGYILVKVFKKQDIRQTGSGNIGATNVARSGSPGLAAATLLLDAGKGSAAVLIGVSIYVRQLKPVFVSLNGASPQDVQFAVPPGLFTAAAIAACAAVIGHMFPVWLRFKGGKGVATAIGAFALAAPLAGLFSFCVFLVVVAVTRYVSLGSIIAAAAFPFFARWNVHHADPNIVFLLTTLTSALIITKHHQNIRRLLAGTENRLGAKPKLPPPQEMEKQA